MIKRTSAITILVALCGFAVLNDSSYAGGEDSDAIMKVRGELQKMIPSAESAEIIATPAEGVYRITLEGSFAYVYVNGDYVLFGDLYDTVQKVNLGELARNSHMAEVINAVSIDQMIVFGPKNAKRYITVFTDIDCGYCRKLHKEIKDLTDAGVQVRYLAFPRSGIGNESYNKYVSVWCSENQQSAMTAAKSGKNPASLNCANPVADTYKLGQRVGVTGTPTIIFDDGTVTPGYQPSALLLERLGLTKKS